MKSMIRYFAMLFITVVLVNSSAKSLESDSTLSLVFDQISSKVPLLELEEVLKTIPKDLYPTNYDSIYAYSFDLVNAIENKRITDSQAATLANYMSNIIQQFEDNCIAFSQKIKRGGTDHLIISLSTGLAIFINTRYHTSDRYGTVTLENENTALLRIEWFDGGIEWVHLVKDKKENIKLTNIFNDVLDYENVKFNEVPMHFLLGCINTYLSQPTLKVPNENESVSIGDTIIYGRYPQRIEDDDYSAVEWIVIKKDKNTVTLLSKYILAIKPYHPTSIKCSWKNSELRKWLNKEFSSKAFTESELKAITPIKHEGSTDTVTILSLKEAGEVFDTYSDYSDSKMTHKNMNKYISASYTAYALISSTGMKNAMHKASQNDLSRHMNWWTCSVNKNNSKNVFCVEPLLFIKEKAIPCNSEQIGVRPVISIDLTKAEYYIKK